MKKRTLDDADDLLQRSIKRPKSGDSSHESNSDEADDSVIAVPTSLSNLSRFKPKAQTVVAAKKMKAREPSSFAQLGISAPLQAALKAMSIRSPTEVQAACIPPLMSGAFSSSLPK